MGDALTDGSQAQSARNRGAALLDLRREQEALPHLHRAAALDPEDPLARVLIGVAELRLGNGERAAEAARAAIGISPELAAGHRTLALALVKCKRGKEAREAAIEACRLEPGWSTSYVVLAEALTAAGDEAGALSAADQAVRCDPESFEAHNARGRMLLIHDRRAEAADAFREALRIDPENPVALNNLGVAQIRRGDYGGALAGFEQATRGDPRMEQSRKNLLAVAGRSRLLRRLAILCLVVAVLSGAFLAGGGRWVFAALFAIAAVVLEAVRISVVRKLSPGTRALLADDARSRRLRPLRWDWKWPTRFRPWWWLMFQKMPPAAGLAANAALVALGVLIGAWVFAVILAIGLPFSALRLWRHWRRTHPGRGSWRPPA